MLDGDVLTRCMVVLQEVAPPPIGGLAARRSHWSRESVVAAVCHQQDSTAVHLQLIGEEGEGGEGGEEGGGAPDQLPTCDVCQRGVVGADTLLSGFNPKGAQKRVVDGDIGNILETKSH